METNEEMVKVYRKLWLSRHHDLLVEDWKLKGKILGSMQTTVGQEAIGIGAGAALKKDDFIMSTHRNRSHMIGKGADIYKMAAEILGKRTGCARGKAGQMLLVDKDVGALGGCGIVGGGTTVALGYAMGFKIQKTNRVALTYFGEGASSEGSTHEAMNFASARKYPVIFLCENNGYCLTVAQMEVTSVKDIADRAQGYGMPGVVIDGTDVMAVYEATKAAAERARRGYGPSLIEAKTWRWGGSDVGDKNEYYPEQYWIDAKNNDPIKKFEEVLIEKEILTEEQAKAIEKEAKETIDDAYMQAGKDPEPGADDFWANVWAD